MMGWLWGEVAQLKGLSLQSLGTCSVPFVRDGLVTPILQMRKQTQQLLAPYEPSA